MVSPPVVLTRWWFWQVLAYIVLAVFFWALLFAPGGLIESRNADRKLIRENAERSIQNSLRGQRACAARKLIVKELIRLSNDPALVDEINALNARYPTIPPCVIER